MNQFEHSNSEEKNALDKIIKKGRVHLYKPIQIAEILYMHRTDDHINLLNVESYRNISKKWRDDVSLLLVGTKCTSSQKYQDDVFNDNAMPPKLLKKLGDTNNETNGAVEKYIYNGFKHRYLQMNSALDYCRNATVEDFYLESFLFQFRNIPGLKRSIDKIYEIVVYSLFSALIEAMGITVSIKIEDTNNELLNEFSDFTDAILGISHETIHSEYPARLFRGGITNAADRGLDMWGNFGLAIQIKHLSLTEEIAEDVTNSISADRIIIVCKDADQRVIMSLLNQLGWKSKIQAIVTLTELNDWYQRAMKQTLQPNLGKQILETLTEQITLEFPATATLDEFYAKRGYES